MAMGTVELHKLDNIMHRDLKASNVLIVCENTSERWIFDLLNSIWFECDVADFESSTGVQRIFDVTLDAFTKKSHVYSCAITWS